MTARALLGPLAAVAFGLLAGCSRTTPLESEILWRLVDADATVAMGAAEPITATFRPAEATRARGPSRAVIADDMRYTFARPEWRLIYRDRNAQVPADGRLKLAPAVPPPFRDCRRVAVRIAMSGPTARDTRSAVGECSGAPAARHVVFSVEVPPALRNGSLDVWVQAREEPPGRMSRRSFLIERVPPHAHLALSYGVESTGWEPGSPAATFVVRTAGASAPLFSATLDPATNPAHRRWLDADISLEEFADTALTLTLETSLADAAEAALDASVWGNPTILIDRPVSEPRPWNVLLVSLDTLRAQSVGAYGRARPTTPIFDALVRQGTLFDTAVAQSTLTPVSNMSMFSALYPRRHGVTDLSAPADSERVPTLPEQFRRARYVTGAITEDGLLQPALGFERGVDEYRENKSADVGSTVGQIERTFRDALHWMSERRTQPFFLFVQTYQVHSPYTPPPPHLGAFGPLDASGPAASRDRYEEEIQYADAWLGKLWSGVQEMGLAARTLLIVTSDHGEEFGEHGALDHGAQLYEETVRVPLLLLAPGLVPTDLRIRAPVGLIDLMPTVLDLLGLPQLKGVDGRSLNGLLGGDETQRALLERELSARFLFAEAWAATRMRVDGTLDPAWRAPMYALRSAGMKLVLTPASSTANRPEKLEIYDLTRDPAEQQAIEPDTSLKTRSHLQALRAYVAAAAAPRPSAEPTPAAPADPATLEKLRALGYLR